MSSEEITRDVLVALLGRINLPTKIGEDKYPAQWVADAYGLIYKAVDDAGRDVIAKQE